MCAPQNSSLPSKRSRHMPPTGCTLKGTCGKTDDVAQLQDLLIYVLKGIAVYGEKAKVLGMSNKENGLFVAQALFAFYFQQLAGNPLIGFHNVSEAGKFK